MVNNVSPLRAMLRLVGRLVEMDRMLACCIYNGKLGRSRRRGKTCCVLVVSLFPLIQ